VLGTLGVGQATTHTGNLVPAGQEAWLQVTFSGNGSTNYHPHITLQASAGEFLFDLSGACGGPGVGLSCGEGTIPAGIVDFETFWNQPGYNNPIAPVGANGVLLIRVFRAPGKPLSCNKYTLIISDLKLAIRRWARPRRRGPTRRRTARSRPSNLPGSRA